MNMIPQGVPADRIWIPVCDLPSALAALDILLSCVGRHGSDNSDLNVTETWDEVSFGGADHMPHQLPSNFE